MVRSLGEKEIFILFYQLYLFKIVDTFNKTTEINGIILYVLCIRKADH